MTVKMLKDFLNRCNDDAEIYISQHTKEGKCKTIGFSLEYNVDTGDIAINEDVVVIRDYNILN